MGFVLAHGAILLFELMPKGLKNSRIHHSSRLMGLAIMVIPIISFIYYFSGLSSAGMLYNVAINISAYCLSITLMATAYYLLMAQMIERVIIKIHLAVGLLYPVPLWLGLIYGSETFAKHILIACYTLFTILGVIHISTLIYFYRQRLKEEKNSSSVGLEKVELEVLKKTLFISVGLMIICIILPSFILYSTWIRAIFSVIFICGSLSIFIRIQQILFSEVTLLTPSDQTLLETETHDEAANTTTATLSEETIQNLKKQIQYWVKSKDFLRPDITMNDVAKATCTNRTYLSRYINTVYNCSFKSWITHLRLEEAKELMHNNPELSVAEIAKQTGFASAESFSHIFKSNEDCPPSKWRESE